MLTGRIVAHQRREGTRFSIFFKRCCHPLTRFILLRDPRDKALLAIWIVLLVLFSSQAYGTEGHNVNIGIFGLWGWPTYEEPLQLIKSGDYSLVVTEPNIDIINKVDKYGLKSIVAFWPQDSIVSNPAEWKVYEESILQKIQSLKSHKAVFAWYVFDEPDYKNVPTKTLSAIINRIKLIDPNHPVMTVLTKSSNWNSYLRFYDIIAIDPYIKDGESLNKIQVWLTDIHKSLAAMNLNKPIWLVLGAFRQIQKANGKRNAFVKPSPSEFNKMVDIAIAGKVAGVLVFSLATSEDSKFYRWCMPVDDPPLWNAVRGMPGKIRAIKR